jgi:hypothetical protein
MMTNFVERRKKSGMSQWLCAQRSGVSRMRLSLAETGQISLSAEEETAVGQVISEYIAALGSASQTTVLHGFRQLIDPSLTQVFPGSSRSRWSMRAMGMCANETIDFFEFQN